MPALVKDPSIFRVTLLEHLLSYLAKAITVQVKVKGSGAPAPGSMMMGASVTPAPPAKWFTRGETTTKHAQLVAKLLLDMAEVHIRIGVEISDFLLFLLWCYDQTVYMSGRVAQLNKLFFHASGNLSSTALRLVVLLGKLTPYLNIKRYFFYKKNHLSFSFIIILLIDI